MEEVHLIDKLDDIVINLNNSMEKLAQLLAGRNVTSEIQNQFDTYLARLNDYYSTQKSFDQLKDKANNLQIYANSIIQKIKKTELNKDKNILSELNSIQSHIEEFKKIAEKREVTFNLKDRLEEINSTIESSNNIDPKDIKKAIEEFKTSLQNTEERHIKKEVTISEKLKTIEVKLSKLEDEANEKIDAVDSLYSETSQKLIEKQKNVDELIGKISGRAIADGYDTNAENEKKSADWLRGLSLTCMLVIAIIIITTLYESENFSLEQAILRLMFSIFLSVPAAYLARESAKHRKQQYTYLQTSLDLKAIDPYIASLPETEQHKLKTEIANRLFVSRDMSDISKDSYPINTHELLMKLIDKLEIKSK